MKNIKKVALLLSFVLILNLTMAIGCSTVKVSQKEKGTEDATTKEERVKLTFFTSDYGVGIPQTVDINNNEFVKFLEDYANVDLQIEVPNYSDFSTKLNLMLSSGNISDIVSSYIWKEVEEAAVAGAFIELRPYYNNSPIMKKVITEQMMELNKASDGKNYCIPMAYKSPSGYGNIARVDLLKKYYNGKWPESVEEWVEFFRIIKKEIPGCIPLTGVGGFGAGTATMWLFYGIQYPEARRVEKGNVTWCFTLPEYREALLLWRQLYKEGILDQEYAVNTLDKKVQRLENNNVAMITDGADQIMAWANYLSPRIEGCEIAYVPPLKKYPAVLKDPNYALFDRLGMPCLIKSQGVYISSKCSYPDRAWRVLEALASEEFLELLVWGREGEEHIIQDGKKVPIVEKLNDPNRTGRYYSIMFALFPGFPAITFSEAKLACIEQEIGSERFNTTYNSLKEANKRAENFGVGVWTAFNRETTDEQKEIDNLDVESSKFIASVVSNVVMGKMSIEEYDEKVKEYKTKYGDRLSEYYTRKLREQKDELIKRGVKFDLGY
ncbi:MAG: extracellular solute-binding protein [Firmicutes bacterium]|nr:extracellular solute-binding protein [Bacillota bacterium]